MEHIQWIYKATYLDQFGREQIMWSNSDSPASLNNAISDLSSRGMVSMEGGLPVCFIERLEVQLSFEFSDNDTCSLSSRAKDW